MEPLFTQNELFDLRLACSEMRQKWMNLYTEAHYENTPDKSDSIKRIYEDYSDLYQKLITLTNE